MERSDEYIAAAAAAESGAASTHAARTCAPMTADVSGGWRSGKRVAVNAPGRQPWPGWRLDQVAATWHVHSLLHAKDNEGQAVAVAAVDGVQRGGTDEHDVAIVPALHTDVRVLGDHAFSE